MTTLFDQTALAKAVHRQLMASPDIPYGARGAFITIANRDGISAGIAIKTAEHWDLKAVVSIPTDQAFRSIDFAVSVTGTF